MIFSESKSNTGTWPISVSQMNVATAGRAMIDDDDSRRYRERPEKLHGHVVRSGRSVLAAL